MVAVFLGKPVNESGGQLTFLSMVRGHEWSAAGFCSGSPLPCCFSRGPRTKSAKC